MTCAPSVDSDQPGHPSSLIRVFAVCMKKHWALNYWAHSDFSYQTGRMPMLIRVFAGRTSFLLVLSCGSSIMLTSFLSYRDSFKMDSPVSEQNREWTNHTGNSLQSPFIKENPSCFQSKWAAAQNNQQNHLCTQQRLQSAWVSAQYLSTWRNLGSTPHWAHMKDSNQTGRMPRILVFTGCTDHFVGFVMLQLNYFAAVLRQTSFLL